MHFCYIIYSKSIDKYYIGETFDMAQRMEYHNSIEKNSNWSKKGIPWEVYLVIECHDRSHARAIEQHVKSMKSRRFIEGLKTHPNRVVALIEKHKV